MDDVLHRIDEWKPSTAAVGVLHDGGHSDHGPTDQAFPLASVTKLLTAYGVLIAAQDGLLHLDEPAGPDGSTVRHLLSHASGLPPAEDGPVTSAGKRRIYSNWGYEILGELVAERTGSEFAEHLAFEVFEPLRMETTRLDGSPAAGAVGTVDDLLLFAAEVLDPTLLDAATVEEATSPVFADLDGVLPGFGRQKPNSWGLGFEIRGSKDPHWTGPRMPARVCGHFGQSGSFLWIDRETGVACAFLSDQAFDSWAAEVWPEFNQAVWERATGR